ncbi:MAG: hypothetical protein FJ272_17220 [Planctomycetes bacterium]|nr:hypothetical protein [Planctomycetota bacterium]
MSEIRICSRCKRSISERDVEEGLAVEKEGKLICPECSGAGPARRAKAQEDTTQLLEAIFTQVKNIARSIGYEETSVWNVFGAVVQCLVFGTLFFAYSHWTTGAATNFLLLSAVLQVMALTFFVLGK